VIDISFPFLSRELGSRISLNQQRRNTELARETAEINHTPLCEELRLDTEHGARLNASCDQRELQILRTYVIADSVAKTSARFGAPTARHTSFPDLSRTKVVGVDLISNRRTKSIFFSASISTCLTSDRSAVISVSSARVARHGVQNADENCTSVIRDPKSVPMSCDEIAEELTRDFLDFTFPWLR
jgi:hypothetical protein